MKKFLFFMLSLFAAVGASAQTVYPEAGEDWARVSPSKYGYNPQKMREIRKFVIDSMNTTGLMVIVGGECIFKFGSVDRTSFIASCRKSVLAMLYGKYVENGTIDLDKSIGELGITDHGGLLPIEQKATVRHLIQARSGIYHPASNSGSALDNPDRLPLRGSKKPGSYFLYNNWDFNAAGSVFEKLTGKGVYQAMEEDLAKPLGFQDWDIAKQRYGGNPRKSMHLPYHIYISTRDMARLGYLMLREGVWDGKQIISKEWHKEMLTAWTSRREVSERTGRSSSFAYGYMWWLYRTRTPELKGAYTARGAMGQFITVIPELDMVIAHKTDSVYGRKTPYFRYRMLINKIIAARED
jgi:CubicO group peptidase (beta-lactamase class C family)